jgi:flagellar motor switch protein FliG
MDDPLRQAAVLLSSLDPSTVEELLNKLPVERADELRSARALLGPVDPREQQQVMRQFLSQGRTAPPERTEGVELDCSLAARLAVPAAPGERATRVEAPADPSLAPPASLEFLEQAPPAMLARYLQREHPQMIALVAERLSPPRAAELLRQFPAPLQADVARRLAQIEQTDPRVLSEIHQELQSWLEESYAPQTPSAGIASLRAILQAAEGAAREQLLANLARQDSRLATRLGYGGTGPVTAPPGNAAEDQRADGCVRLGAQSAAATRRADVVPRPATPRVAVASDLAGLMQLDRGRLAELFRRAGPEVAARALSGGDRSAARELLRKLPYFQARRLRQRMHRLGTLSAHEGDSARQKLNQLAQQVLAATSTPDLAVGTRRRIDWRSALSLLGAR